MEAVLTRPAWPPKPDGLGTFGNWLLCWILLPNIGFWLLWIVGGPPRAIEIVLTGCIGLALHRAPFWLKYAGFLLAMGRSVLAFISGMFNLSVDSLLVSIPFVLELNPLESPQYVLAGLAVAATLGLAWKLLRRSTVLARPLFIVAAMAITMTAAVADTKVVMGSRGSYKRMPEPGALFTSAARSSGWERLATGDRHVMMVMVESMGLPVDEALRRRLVDIWARPEVRGRYDVIVGDSLYYGSTTAGEIRELCGRWGDYKELLTRDDPGCLPAELAAKGYESSAWHSFSGKMFDRTIWYPNIGFQQMRFGERLMEDGAARCPGVFPGACDRDVPAQIAAALKAEKDPQFLYWLTVNSHLPVLKEEELATEECASFDAALDAGYPMICRLFQLFDQTGQALAREITAPDFPATDILIVGDHIPPFFDRYNRDRFAPDRVPWILLRPKAAKPGFASL